MSIHDELEKHISDYEKGPDLTVTMPVLMWRKLLDEYGQLLELTTIGAECVYGEGQGLWQDYGRNLTAERFRELYEDK